MTEAIEYEQFEQGAPAGAGSASEPDLARVSDIPMELSVEIGRTHMTIGETLELKVGSVVTLEREAGQAVDLLVNGTAIARGEVIVVEEQYGLRVTEILDGQRDGEPSSPAARAVGEDEDAAGSDGEPAGETTAQD